METHLTEDFLKNVIIDNIPSSEPVLQILFIKKVFQKQDKLKNTNKAVVFNKLIFIV